MERSIGFLLRIVVALAISSSSYAGIDDVPSPFREDVQCMVKVLRETPRVDQVEAGVVNSDGWAHPFVQYRYQEQDAREGTVRFIAKKSNDSQQAIYFVAALNGLSTPGGPPPPTLGVGEIVRRWELQCRVRATAVFV